MTPPRILIVEDDASIGLVVSAALQAENIETFLCDSVAARDTALANGHFDLMLTDVLLKDSDGLATLKEAIERSPDMPVIIMSAQNTLETAVRASEIDAFEYFPKPFDLNDLVLAVKQGIEKRRSTEHDPFESLTEANIPMIGRSAAMQDVYRMVARLLRNDLSVLISGESGTGKELVAEAIHNLGHRKTGPFVAVNMAAIPSELIEAELFGHEKGAFTSAVKDRKGKFELASGGTLFLDEIGDMSLSAQAKVLRALQENVIQRVGGEKDLKVDCRVLAATNKDLREEIKAGRFREDLFHRLAVILIHVPALNERRSDIPMLVQHFLKLVCQDHGIALKTIEAAAVKSLQDLNWTGNIRELRNIIERLVILSDQCITAVDVQRYANPSH